MSSIGITLTGIFALSLDNCYARSDDDDMSWTGRIDKQLFALLSLSNHGVCLCGRKTYEAMPKTLKGRDIVCLKDNNLLEVSAQYPHANIIGGKEVLLSAFAHKLIDSFYLMRIPINLNSRLKFEIDTYLPTDKLIAQYKFPNEGDTQIIVSAYKGINI